MSAMSGRALVTRPLEDAGPVVVALRRRGIECMVEPMLRIVPLPAPAIDLDGVQGLVVTSANGARAFAAACRRRDLPVYAVGDASAAAARELGFSPVESADGDVAGLADLVARHAAPGAGALFHPAGRVSAGDLSGRLQALGFSLRRSRLYEARPIHAFSAPLQAALAALRDGGEAAPAAVGLRWVLFFSPRTAATFVSLSETAGLADACRRLIALCLSGNVAAAARAIEWRAVAVAARPEQEALLALLDPETAPGVTGTSHTR